MINEDQLEQLCLTWFQETGYDYVCAYDIAPYAVAPSLEKLKKSVSNQY
jgi:type I restriction enzyme, R subunit